MNKTALGPKYLAHVQNPHSLSFPKNFSIKSYASMACTAHLFKTLLFELKLILNSFYDPILSKICLLKHLLWWSLIITDTVMMKSLDTNTDMPHISYLQTSLSVLLRLFQMYHFVLTSPYIAIETKITYSSKTKYTKKNLSLPHSKVMPSILLAQQFYSFFFLA